LKFFEKLVHSATLFRVGLEPAHDRKDS
jgi:hypothetical protein